MLSHQKIVNLMGNTTTKTGPLVRAELDTNTDDIGINVGDTELAQLKRVPHEFHGEWYYQSTSTKMKSFTLIDTQALSSTFANFHKSFTRLYLWFPIGRLTFL